LHFQLKGSYYLPAPNTEKIQASVATKDGIKRKKLFTNIKYPNPHA